MSLTPNPTNDRLRFILKTYGQKKPEVVMDMIDIIARTVGVDDWAARIDHQLRPPAGPYLKDEHLAVAQYLQDLEAWYHSRRLRELVTTTPDLATTTVALVNELPQFKTRHRADPLFPWMATQLVKIASMQPTPGTPFVTPYHDWLSNLRRGGTMLAQWYEATRPNLGEYTLDSAWREAKEWEAESGPVPQGEVVAKLSDGWTAQKLTTRQQLDAEGNKMQHCVGSYAGEVERGGTTIYSLRDPKGQPHVTIEVKKDRVQQTQGKQNRKPDEKYKKYVDEFNEWLEENEIDTAKIPADLQPYIDVFNETHQDVEEEYEQMYARDWQGEGFSAEQMREWFLAGMSYSDYELAGALEAEDVEPDEYAKFPSPILYKIHEDGGVPRELDYLVKVARMVTALANEDEERQRRRMQSPRSQVELPLDLGPRKERRVPGHDPGPTGRPKSGWLKDRTVPLALSGQISHWYSDWARDDDDVRWIYPAEEWLDYEFSSDADDDNYVGPWFTRWFTPEQADDWWAAGIENAEVAGELRGRRITPEQIEDLKLPERVLARTNKGDIRELNEALVGAGIQRNPRRSSRRVR